MHYAKMYKMEINRLKKIIDEYYRAVYHLKELRIPGESLKGCGVYGGLPRLEGYEEGGFVGDIHDLKRLIDELPLIDPGMLIEV